MYSNSVKYARCTCSTEYPQGDFVFPIGRFSFSLWEAGTLNLKTYQNRGMRGLVKKVGVCRVQSDVRLVANRLWGSTKGFKRNIQLTNIN